jgi:N-glycosidase YbiA
MKKVFQVSLDGKKQILFYGRKNEYGWMSNFERAPQIVDGLEYQTNEHYYQATKANSEVFRKWIADAPNPFAAMKAGRALRPEEMTDNWEDIKFDIMLKGLLAKYSQNPDLKQKLLDTGDMDIHEDSPTDMIWGIRGKDMLGKLIMKVRSELR